MKISRVERVELCHRSRNGQIDSGRSRNFSTIRNEYMSAIYPIGTMPAQLVVKEEDAKRAAELLDKCRNLLFAAIQGVREALKEAPNSL